MWWWPCITSIGHKNLYLSRHLSLKSSHIVVNKLMSYIHPSSFLSPKLTSLTMSKWAFTWFQPPVFKYSIWGQTLWNKDISTEFYLQSWPKESIGDNKLLLFFRNLALLHNKRLLTQLDFHKYFKTLHKIQQLLFLLLLACVISLTGFMKQSWQTSAEKIPKMEIIISKECLQSDFLNWARIGQRKKKNFFLGNIKLIIHLQACLPMATFCSSISMKYLELLELQ